MDGPKDSAGGYGMFKPYKGREPKPKELIYLKDRYPQLPITLYGKRLKVEMNADFMIITEMLREGLNWIEIAEVMNVFRPYTLTAASYRTGYRKRISQELTSETARQELETLLDYYDNIIKETIISWRNSKGIKMSVTRQGRVDKDNDTRLEKEYQIIHEMESQGDVKYLELMLKAVKSKEQLLNNLMKLSFKDDDNLIFTEYEIDDDFGNKALPIHSEDDIEKFSDFET